MAGSNILIVAVDGLRALALGAYGNTTFRTSGFDSFAAVGTVFDCCYGSSDTLDGIYHTLLRSQHPTRLSDSSQVAANESASLVTVLSSLGYATALISDDASVTSIADAMQFADVIEVGDTLTAEAGPPRARDESETSFARLFATAQEYVANSSTGRAAPPRLVWVHSRGMYGPWDAPLELQELVRDDDDPQPIDSTYVPETQSGDDPDVAFQYTCAYAAQIMALDACFRDFLDFITDADREREWLIVFLGVRGFSLGEHQYIGGIDSRLYSEQLHVPLIVRLPGGRNRLTRCSQLVSHFDLMPTLLDCAGNQTAETRRSLDGQNLNPIIGSPRASWREELVALSESGSRAIRTPAWCLREILPASDSFFEREGLRLVDSFPDRELYVRPDDRWEANDVAKLMPDVLDELSQRLADAERSLATRSTE